MSEKERKRLGVMEQVKCGAISIAEAAESLGLSYRQARRVHTRFVRGGVSGLIHAGCGKESNRRLDEGIRDEALEFYEQHLEGYGPTLAAEVLAEDFDVHIHRETLRRLLHEHHLIVPRCRERQHRRRRKRRSCFGELVQIDGSLHHWFGPDEPACCLMVMVDDATGRTLCFFSEQETTEAAFRVYRKWVERNGAPEALYADRKNVYVVQREATESELATGSGAQSDFGRACWRLGTCIIQAHSPQAKGRVERMNGLLQDRLVKELERRSIRTIDAANAMIDGFTDRLAEKFAVAPASDVDRHRKRPSKAVLDETLCWEEERTVGRDWTISYKGVTYQIERQATTLRPYGRVSVRRYLSGGQIAIFHKGERLRFHEFRHRRATAPAAEKGCGNAVL
jgi:transposase